MTEEENRNLENIVGNLMVARYQVYRLEQKLAEEIDASLHGNREANASFVYKYGKHWYRINLTADRLKDFDELSIKKDREMSFGISQ